MPTVREVTSMSIRFPIVMERGIVWVHLVQQHQTTMDTNGWYLARELTEYLNSQAQSFMGHEPFSHASHDSKSWALSLFHNLLNHQI